VARSFSWSLRDNNKIGNININTDHSRLILTFYYENIFQFFLNDFFFNDIKNYLKQQGSDMQHFQIDKITYNSLVENNMLTDKNNIVNINNLYLWKA
jgi:hypothetical protein